MGNPGLSQKPAKSVPGLLKPSKATQQNYFFHIFYHCNPEINRKPQLLFYELQNIIENVITTKRAEGL
jgi:hypothetical protein